MKVSCLPVSLFQAMLNNSLSIKEWARIAVEIGLDGIDLSQMLIKNHTPVYLKQVRNDLESEGINIVMITTYPDFSHPDALQREREMEYLRHDIAVASYLGAKYLRILAGQAYPGITRSDGIKWVVENFKRASSVADKFGIKLLYENHSKPGAWDYYDFSHPTEIFLDISNAIRDTSIKINFDTGNTLVYGDDPILVMKSMIDRIETIHASDIAEVGRFKPVLLGEGVVPFKEIFSILKAEEFDGWICVEEASDTGKEGIEKAVNYIRKAWQDA